MKITLYNESKIWFNYIIIDNRMIQDLMTEREWLMCLIMTRDSQRNLDKGIERKISRPCARKSVRSKKTGLHNSINNVYAQFPFQRPIGISFSQKVHRTTRH